MDFVKEKLHADQIYFLFSGILSKAKFASLDTQRFLTKHGSFWGFFTFSSEKERLELASLKAKHEIQLSFWLQQLCLDAKYYNQLLSQGINSVESLIDNLNTIKLQQIFEDEDFDKLQEAIKVQDEQSFEDSLPFRSAVAVFSFSWWSIKFVGEFCFLKRYQFVIKINTLVSMKASSHYNYCGRRSGHQCLP